MYAVYKKELRSSLLGMTGPIFICAVLGIMGFFTAYYQFTAGYSQFEYTIADGTFWSLLLAPILTMRSFTEERRSRTDQLLYSLPITTTSVVIGKYLALVTVFAIPCAILCIYPLVVSAYTNGTPNLAIAYGAILAYFLLGCLVIAIGTFISSLFESQVICAIVNLSLLLVLYFMTTVTSYISDSAVVSLVFLLILAAAVSGIVYFSVKNIIASAVTGGVLAAAALVVYFVNAELYTGLAQRMISTLFIFTPVSVFAFGTFDITCFIYYLSLTVLFVFFTIQSFEKRRWD